MFSRQLVTFDNSTNVFYPLSPRAMVPWMGHSVRDFAAKIFAAEIYKIPLGATIAHV